MDLDGTGLKESCDYTCILHDRVQKVYPDLEDIIPYPSFGDTIPVPTVARVHFLSLKLCYNTTIPALAAMLFC